MNILADILRLTGNNTAYLHAYIYVHTYMHTYVLLSKSPLHSWINGIFKKHYIVLHLFILVVKSPIFKDMYASCIS